MVAKEPCKKIEYKDRKKAWKSAARFFSKYGDYSSPYKCRYCGKFHLTTHSRGNPVPSKDFIETFNKWYGSEIL